MDNHDFQIVKTCGRNVPDTHAKKKNEQENLTPKFVTYREQIDGQYWFPTYTRADDTLLLVQDDHDLATLLDQHATALGFDAQLVAPAHVH